MSDEKNRSIPPELQARLEQESPADRDELERVWHLLEQGRPSIDPPEADETWQGLASQLDAVPSEQRARRATNRTARHSGKSASRRRRWATAAAIGAVVVGIAVSALLWRQPVRMSAPAGTSKAVSLPDGSSVELSSGTTLSYRRGFEALPFFPAERRAVTLRGEAFFDVREGARAFVVKTFNARVEVLGTRFNVRAWPETTARETRVTLASGRVQVAAASFSGHPVTLKAPGQSSHVTGTDAPPTAPQDTSTQRVLAWRQQGFAVSNQSLSSIFSQLERRYNVRLTLHDETAATDSMTLFYAREADLETILHDICVAKGLNYRATSRGYEVFRKAPSPPGNAGR